jgi:hypothetical protein
MKDLKKLQLIKFIILFIIVSAFSASAVAIDPNAIIEWQNTTVDFGKIPIENPVTAEFSFKNPGMIPLIITEVKSSCGCTVADYPKQPIAPGGQGKIIATYDAKLSGYFNKTITVYSNTEDGITELYIKGEVAK